MWEGIMKQLNNNGNYGYENKSFNELNYKNRMFDRIHISPIMFNFVGL